MSLAEPIDVPAGDAAGAAFRRAAELSRLDPSSLSDQQLVDFLHDVETAQAHLSALQLAGARELDARSHPDSDGVPSLAHTLGHRSPVQALAMVTRVSEVEARRRIKDVRHLARLPILGQAVYAGRVGREHAQAVIDRLRPALRNADPADLCAAEEALVASCRTLQVELVDEQARLWAAALDPDGPPPDEEPMTRRFFTISPVRDGVAKVAGLLPAEHATVIRSVFEAYAKPRAKVAFAPGCAAPGTAAPDGVAPGELAPDADVLDAPADTRTPGQKRADTLRDVFALAARSADVPTMGGDHPTVWIATTTPELEDGRGTAFFRTTPVPIAAAEQASCAGGLQEVVFGPDGDVLRLGRTRRGFSYAQRRAIALRDGPSCAIPGCTTPAAWCETHHVIGYRDGGPTDVDNGILLCWYHHHTIDTGPWRFRIRDGTAWVRWVLGRHASDWTPVNPARAVRLRT
ncbi:HNH endonuclease signature motif containing protein [Gryllotalpicola ginsengisoli]|uniref:HNH endonuclease signature motif containing protein n=1 Tax=Gryllotalpicola ginsengisoli TaxID=444608 RepID=UPI0003B732AA|nr:HNH endonuclease signature motif containing protein [Gryllotalpicola ginsengisoli]